jgi:hypothetical protein
MTKHKNKQTKKQILFPFPSRILEKIQVREVASSRPLKRPSKVT